MSTEDRIAKHRAAGRLVAVDGVNTFVRAEGDDDPVLLLHGVPVSSWLYRRVLPALAARGLRGIAYDFPGLGLSDRPVDFDYSWSGLGRHAVRLVDALGLDRFHLVVHDIGGPVGFELAHAAPARVRSLTLLNTVVDPARFHRPWTMHPFSIPGVDRLWLASIARPVFRWLMGLQGVLDRSAVTNAEIDVHYALLFGDDGGRAFLRIMKGFELTEAKSERYAAVVADPAYPRRVVWGAHDPALRLDREGRIAQQRAGVELHTVPAKHFLQEDQAEAVADHVAACAAQA